MATLIDAQARSMAGTHTGIRFESASGDPPGVGEVAKLPIRIERVPERRPHTRAWRMRIGDELATRLHEGEIVVLRLSDEDVRALQEHAIVEFEPGQPDWDLRRVEHLEDHAFHLREKAEKAERAALEARAAWNAACEPTDPEGPGGP